MQKEQTNATFNNIYNPLRHVTEWKRADTKDTDCEFPGKTNLKL